MPSIPISVPHPPSTDDVPSRLEAVDWSFSVGRSSTPLESLHPYPAKFVPDIPGTLLDLLPIPEGTCVLDPFVGSGTTLVESQKRGIPSVGIDLNPIACLISRVKTQPTPKGLEAAASGISQTLSLNLGAERHSGIPNIDHWFPKDIQTALASIRYGIAEAPAELHDALNLAMSSIVVRVSNQDSDTRYAAVAKNVRGEDVVPLFRSAAARIESALGTRDWPLVDAVVVQSDAQTVSPASIGLPVGAVITSPPYPNAYEYWLYHKYRMYWLDHDPIPVREAEIGARPHFFKKNPHTPHHFFAQMTSVFSMATAKLVSDGWLCVVVGRSRIQGVDVDNGQIIIEVARELGLVQEADITRPISQSRKSFNLSHARIKTERVLVFRRP